MKVGMSLNEWCPTYDVSRDVDLFWDCEQELGNVFRVPMSLGGSPAHE